MSSRPPAKSTPTSCSSLPTRCSAATASHATRRPTPDPVWDYGRWKARAERIVVERSGRAAVVRLPLLVSVDPDDHVVREIRAGAARGETTRWFTDETRQPALAHEVAAAVWRIAALTAGARSGTWHLAGSERLTRYEIALRVVDRLGLSPDVVEAGVDPGGRRPPSRPLLHRCPRPRRGRLEPIAGALRARGSGIGVLSEGSARRTRCPRGRPARPTRRRLARCRSAGLRVR